MLTPGERQRSGRLLSWAGGALLVLFAGLSLYHVLDRYDLLAGWRFHSDAALLRELQQGPAPVAKVRGTTLGDWPQWRGPHRDGISDETGLQTEWPPEGPPKLWEVPVGEGYSSVAVAGGRVCTLFQDGDREAVVCFDAKTGAERWRYRGYPDRFVNDMGVGPRSTPALDGDRVYAVGARGKFYCLKADDGSEVWAKDLLQEFNAPVPQWGVSFSPLVEGDLVFMTPGGAGGNSVAAFDKHTGKLAWKALDDPPGYSSPVLATLAGVPQLLCFTGNALAGLSPTDGTLYWRFPWETAHHCNISTPIVAGDYVFISSGYGKGCALLKVAAGDPGPPQARPVYTHTKLRNHFSSSVYYQGRVYGFDEAFLTCLDLRTGKVGWRERAGFQKGSLLVADGHLFILGESGKLAVAEANPAGYREKSSFRFSTGRCWVAPALADGKLYVRDESKLACYDVRKH